MQQPGGGAIVNIASILGERVMSRVVPYAVSKAGLIQMTKGLALEWARYGIRVNALAPGGTLSEENPTQERIQAQAGRLDGRPLARVELPSDLVGPMVFLCSDDSDFMTGQAMIVDSGATCRLSSEPMFSEDNCREECIRAYYCKGRIKRHSW